MTHLQNPPPALRATTFTSFRNDADGHCAFLSFKQALPAVFVDSVHAMRDNTIAQIEATLGDYRSRAAHLNEHIWREKAAGNPRWQRVKSLDTEKIQPIFNELWAAYIRDMQNDSYVGMTEIAACAAFYGVNVSVWILRRCRDSTVRHYMTTPHPHTQCAQTVHLLNIEEGPGHFESTNIPLSFLPNSGSLVPDIAGLNPPCSVFRNLSYILPCFPHAHPNDQTHTVGGSGTSS